MLKNKKHKRPALRNKTHKLEQKRFLKLLGKSELTQTEISQRLGLRTPQVLSNKIRRWNWTFLEKKALAEILEVETNKIWVE